MGDPFSFARRDLFKGAIAGAGLSFLAQLASPRAARADLRPGAPARRVLILNLFGGVRSSAAFCASRARKYNPYDVIAGTGTPFALGRFLDDYLPELGEKPIAPAAYRPGGAWGAAQITPLRDMASTFSVLGTWDAGRGDHILERTKAPTGSGGGDQAGILTRVGAGLADALRVGDLEFPTFHLEPGATFGRAGDLARYVPVSLASPRSLPGAGDTSLELAEIRRLTGNDWAKDDAMRGRLDQLSIAKRGRSGKDLASTFAIHRHAAHAIGGTLAQPYVNVPDATPTSRAAVLGKANVAADGGSAQYVDLTNQMLYDALSNALGAADPTQHPSFASAMNVAIAVRLLQLKSRAVCVEVGNFDYHSGEREGRYLYAFLGRLWTTLSWLLRRIPDPDMPSKSLYDTTLVLTMSDFGRDPGGATGYNGGEGSDHGADPSCYYLAHAVMGGGARGGRLLSAVDTTTYRADQIPERYGERDLLAMILYSLGLDPKNPSWGFEDVTAPMDGLWRA